MFTLQILDRGQTFLHSVDDRALLLGSDPAADIVLGEAGVAPRHARIEPHADGARLVSLAATSVNGRNVQQAELALGDRVELGRAVLVVGRAVTRPASPDDVLAESLSRSRRRSSPRRSMVLPFAVLAGAALVGAWLWLARPAPPSVEDELAVVRQLRLDGQLERVHTAIDTLGQRWRSDPDDRLQRLAAERDAVAAVETAIDRLTQRVLDPTDNRGYAQWSQELRRVEQEGPVDEQVAARHVRGKLAATLLERARPQLPEPGPQPSPAVLAAADTAPTRSGEPAPAPAAPRDAAVVPVDAPGAAAGNRIDSGEVDGLVRDGQFAQALALLQASLGEQDSETEVVRVQTRSRGVRELAGAAMKSLLEEAARAAAGGAREGAKVLAAARHRFPREAEFAALDDQICKYEVLAAERKPVPETRAVGEPAVDESARLASLAAVRAQMDAVRVAEERCAFAEAAQGLRAAAAGVQDRDAEFAARLLVRAEDAANMAAWHDAVAAALRNGKPLATTHNDGRALAIASIDGADLVASGNMRCTWLDISPAGLRTIADQIEVGGTAALGAAALLYKQGQGAAAEAQLAKLVRAEPASKELVDRALARGRGEPFDGRGYVLGKDGFQSVRSVEVQKQASALASRLETALRDKNPATRDALWKESLASGPDMVPVLAAALQKELRRQIARLEAGPLKKQIDKLASQRVLLDDARTFAKDLIFDEQKYLYPFRPPAVSGERAAEYSRVQAEVDRRVDALRTLWDDDRLRVRIPSSLRTDIDRIDWLAKNLGDLGGLEQSELAQVDWVRALPSGDSIGVHDYCKTAAERAELEEWRHVESYNAVVAKKMTSAQREQLKVTNEYRAMFRHRPLAMVASMCAASQAHADEMSKLGYFAHMSPTPGRKTPFDRMNLAGYRYGVSENIALHDSAFGAHVAWCHSAGHHRNLLNASHEEIGIGASGRNWVQNFGTGRVHCDEPAWSETRSGGR